MPPLVIHALVPLSTHSSAASSYVARVLSELTSDPASGSDTQNAPSWMASAVPKHCGTHSSTCSGRPAPAMPAAARPEPKMDRPMPASPQNSSSSATGSVRPDESPSDAWAKKSKE